MDYYLDLKISRVTKLEYRANHDVDTVIKNLRNLFGYYAIDVNTTEYRLWLFKQADFPLFNNMVEYHTKLAKRFPRGMNQYLNGLLSQINFDGVCLNGVNIFDGRLGYVVTREELVVIDMFRGEFKSIPFGVQVLGPIEFVDEERFLVVDYENCALALFKLDYDESTVEKLDSIQIDDDLARGCLILEQLNPSNFFIADGKLLHTGKIVENNIVFGETINLGVEIERGVSKGTNFQDIWFTDSSSCKFFEFNLETRKLTSLDVETKFENGDVFDLTLNDPWSSSHCWTDECFYVPYTHKTIECWRIAALNTKTLKWHDTGIQVWETIRKTHVDQDGFLTVVTDHEYLPTKSFYRFPLKKPDSLMNLAWFSYTNRFKKTGKRGKLFKRLPYTCILRSQLPGAE